LRRELHVLSDKLLGKNGEIQRISRGVYSANNYMTDEMASIQARYKGAIFSHETALYLLGLTEIIGRPTVSSRVQARFASFVAQTRPLSQRPSASSGADTLQLSEAQHGQEQEQHRKAH
jgi:hypothetical protein